MGNHCQKCCSKLFGTSQISTSDLKEHLNEHQNYITNIANKTNRASTNSIWHTKTNFEDFNILKLLGRGSYGKVVLAKKISNGKLYALKILNKGKIKIQNQVDHTKTERIILEVVNSAFIVHLKYAFQTEEKLCFVTEYMPGGELFYHLRHEKYFCEDKAKFYMCELILAISHLHNNNCIYRDLKPENILLGEDGHIKLTDFGLSKITFTNLDDENVAYTICGTPEYLAPEILEGKGYNKSVDWWSLGALLYEMLIGYSPFKPKNKEKKIDIKIYYMPVDYKPYLSREVRSLIMGLLTVEPTLRLGSGITDAEEIKSHNFFKDIDWDEVKCKELKPPYIPIIRSKDDYSNFDKVFTQEDPFKETPTNNILLENYNDFTYEKNELSGCCDKDSSKGETEIKDIHIKREIEDN